MNVTEQRLETKAVELEKQLDAANQRNRDDRLYIEQLYKAIETWESAYIEQKTAKEAAERKLATAGEAIRVSHILLDSKSRNADRIEELLRKALAQIEQPRDTPAERLTRDEWAAINKLRGDLINHAINSGIETPLLAALQKIAMWHLEPFVLQRGEALRWVETLAGIEPDVDGLEALARRHHRSKQRLSSEDPPFGACPCLACQELRAKT